MSRLIVIPARIGSTRLPRKPLLEIKGKPTIQYVYEAAADTSIPTIVATDSEEIADIVRTFGGEVVLTDSDLRSGSDRVAQAVERYDPHLRYTEVMNLQGDMPFVTTEHILDAFRPLVSYDIGTIVYDMDEKERENPNSVKAIVSWNDEYTGIGKANWFVRASIPYGYHHAGVYAYQRSILRRYASLSSSNHEQIERLEQLRALDWGLTIGCWKTSPVAGEINTQEDLDNANK